MGKLLEKRRSAAQSRIEAIRAQLVEAEKRCGNRACVYITGSYGRGEATRHSDLDLFIAGKGTKESPALTKLDEILLKADLIEATRELGFEDFSGDGEYLVHYTVDELLTNLGKPEDDANNTFTARLLLLLESSPLIERSVYKYVIEEVIGKYWRDYQDHKNEFRPAFLANDILRMWRTFCVNYEARTFSDPPEKKAKRRLKNYKLKHSRLLTCYSALLYLLAVWTKSGTVSPKDAMHMVSLSPTGRLKWLLTQRALSGAHSKTKELISCYEEFLSRTDAPEEELVRRFMEKKSSVEYFETGSRLGDAVFDVLHTIGNGSQFHRLLVV